MPLADFEFYMDRLETERSREHDALKRQQAAANAAARSRK